ncbi:MAG: hypothetical protein WB676_08765 [Bryobacteraceae bacterium]
MPITTCASDECTIPPPVSDEALNRFKFDAGNEHEADRIAKYVERQCSKDKEHVTYLEKVKTESVFGANYGCWNIRTDKGRYWVITSPTNLYSQELFPSLDYTLSFHIGLMARVQSLRKGAKDEMVGDRLATAFRRWEQAAEALDASIESEEIQAVAMRCRECLLAFLRSIANPSMVPADQEAPKAGDFIHWSEIIADAISPGSRAAEVRGYLKAIARSTWQLVSWLTHAANAVRYDGTLAVDATYAVLNAYGAAILRFERPTSDRCSRCNSLRIQIVEDLDFESGLGIACGSCGFIEDATSETPTS